MRKLLIVPLLAVFGLLAATAVASAIPAVQVRESTDVTTVAPGNPVTFYVNVYNTTGTDESLTSLVSSAFGDLNGVGTCSTGGTISANGEYDCQFVKIIMSPNFLGNFYDTVTATVDSTNSANGSTSVEVTFRHNINNNNCGFCASSPAAAPYSSKVTQLPNLKGA